MEEPKEQSLSEILDFAIRDVVEKAALTDEMICPMIADLKLDVWVTSYCNVYFYRSEVFDSTNSSHVFVSRTGSVTLKVKSVSGSRIQPMDNRLPLVIDKKSKTCYEE